MPHDRVAVNRLGSPLKSVDAAQQAGQTKAHHALGQTAPTRRDVLAALEIAPRFRPALALLLELGDRARAGAIASNRAGDAPPTAQRSKSDTIIAA